MNVAIHTPVMCFACANMTRKQSEGKYVLLTVTGGVKHPIRGWMHALPVKHRQMALLQIKFKRASCVSVFLSSLSVWFASRLHLSCRTCWWCPCLPTQRRPRTHTGRSADPPAFLKSLYRLLTFFVCVLFFSLHLFPLPSPSRLILREKSLVELRAEALLACSRTGGAGKQLSLSL